MGFRSNERCASLLGPGILAGFTLLFFNGALRGRCLFGMDFHLTFQPLRLLLGEAWHQGSVTWNPWLSNGVPLLANPLNSVFYPPNLLFGLIPSSVGLTLLTVAHVAAGALGAWCLARRRGTGEAGSLATGLVFGFNGLAVSATAFTNLCWAWAWLPWLLLAWDGLTSGGPRRTTLASGGAFTAISAVLLVLGDPFVLGGGLLGVGLLSVARVFEVGPEARGAAIRTVLLTMAGLAAGCLLAAPALVAYAGYVPLSVRGAGFTWDGVTLWSLHPVHVLESLLPGAFGDASIKGFDGGAGFWAQQLVPVKQHPLFLGLYVGGAALALGILGAMRRGRRDLVLVIWIGVLLLLALGRYGPLYWVLQDLPGFAALRFPVKWLLTASLPLALLAGSGVDDLSDARRRSRALMVFGGVLLFVVIAAMAATPGLDGALLSLAGVTLGPEATQAIRDTYLMAALRAKIPLILAVGLVLWARRGHRPTAAGPAMVLLLGCDLLLANFALAPTAPARFYSEPPRVVQAVKGDPGGYGRVFVEDPALAAPVFIRRPREYVERSRWQRDELRGYTGAAYGLTLAFNSDTEAFNPLHYTRLKVLVEGAPLREKLMLLGASGVTHVVTHRNLDSPWLEPVATIDDWTDPPQRVYRNRLAIPRLRIVPSLVTYRDYTEFTALIARAPDDLFHRVALVEGDSGGAMPELPLPRTGDEASLVVDRGSFLEVRTRGAGGFLVVSDCDLPGWRASVDGKPEPVLRVDYAFRAVAVPAGEHVVALTYRPW